MYRTGDRARRRADGALEYLGRADRQVKIAATASARRDRGRPAQPPGRGRGGRRRVRGRRRDPPAGRPSSAPAPATAPHRRRPPPNSAPTWRGRCAAHMVPAAYVPLAALPLYRQRQARPARPARARPRRLRRRRHPHPLRTPAERLVAAAWTDVLDTDEVGADDDFFALGGDSILAVRVTSRPRRLRHGRLSTTRLLFALHPVSALAAALAEPRAGDSAGAGRPPPGRPGTAVVRPATLWFSTGSSRAAPSTPPCPCCGCASPLDTAALRTALDGLSSPGTPPCAPRSPNATARRGSSSTRRGPWTSRVDDLADTAALDALLDREAATPFDLTTGPLFRARLARLGAEEHVLVLAAHHIVTDGWSSGVLARDLGEAVHGGPRGPPPGPASSRPVRYTDYATWQRTRTEQHESGLAYWRGALDGVTPLELPTDRPRPAVRTRDGALVTFTLPAALTERLRERGRGVRRHPLHDAGGGLPGAARPLGRPGGRHRRHRHRRPRTARTARPRRHVRQHAGAARPGPPDLPFRELLGEVRTTVLEAFAHQEVPFERVVDALQPSGTPAAPRCSRSWSPCTTSAPNRPGCPA